MPRSREGRIGITDVHVHLQPFERGNRAALGLLRRTMKDFDTALRMMKDPRALLDHLDAAHIERACLVNYPAPEVLGLKPDMNPFLSRFASEDPRRLIPIGSVHPRFSKNPGKEVEHVVSKLGIRGLKVHPPHQLFASNGYVDGSLPQLRDVYRAAERAHIPVMVHTGTSIFPGARTRYCDPMGLDDVAQDFPDLTLIMAHGGRPLWCELAFFLVRRHPNLYLDISGIPPRRLLEWFPRVETIREKVLFGSDWPGPDIPGIAEEVAAIEALPLSEELKERMFSTNASKIFR